MQAVIFTALVQAPCALLHQPPNFWHLRKESQIFTVQHIFNAKPPGKGAKFPRPGADPWAVPPASMPFPVCPAAPSPVSWVFPLRTFHPGLGFGEGCLAQIRTDQTPLKLGVFIPLKTMGSSCTHAMSSCEM